MIYSNIVYSTNLDSAYYDGLWHMFYTITQSRKNLSGIKEEREVTFGKESNTSYESLEKEVIQEAFKELSQVGFDLFKLPSKDYISLKARLEDGKTKNNQITKD